MYARYMLNFQDFKYNLFKAIRLGKLKVRMRTRIENMREKLQAEHSCFMYSMDCWKISFSVNLSIVSCEKCLKDFPRLYSRYIFVRI